jgi:hypothetical protein
MNPPSKRQRTKDYKRRFNRRGIARASQKAVKSTSTPLPAPLEKVMFVLEPADLEWLDTTVARIKPGRRRTSKSELMRLGIGIMKNMDPEELRQRLRDLD